jgi:hypothetical protein
MTYLRMCWHRFWTTPDDDRNLRQSGRPAKGWTLSEPDASEMDATGKWWLRGTVIALVCFWVGIVVLVRGCM